MIGKLTLGAAALALFMAPTALLAGHGLMGGNGTAMRGTASSMTGSGYGWHGGHGMMQRGMQAGMRGGMQRGMAGACMVYQRPATYCPRNAACRWNTTAPAGANDTTQPGFAPGAGRMQRGPASQR